MDTLQSEEFNNLLEENFPDFVERGAAREFMRMSEEQRWMWMLSSIQAVSTANGTGWKGHLGNLVYTSGGIGTLMWLILTGRIAGG